MVFKNLEFIMNRKDSDSSSDDEIQYKLATKKHNTKNGAAIQIQGIHQNPDVVVAQQFKDAEGNPKQPQDIPSAVKNMGEQEQIEVTHFHLSCQGSSVAEWKKQNLAGMIIYSELMDYTRPISGKNLRIRPGYVYIKASQEVKALSREGQVHGGLFYSLFEQQPSDLKLVTSGFARVDGKWKFNSITLSTKTEGWHDSDKEMSAPEQKELKKALKHWEKGGEQNYAIQRDAKCSVF
ncbi:hypothetical protein FGO68_gene11172 [Halteria grandinella]|uniref:Uncharacterized protein n=1 Tax=Halteria grandinella TaxID=5974 RepID=A0A8J8NG88_HALGN|nr:hypothetical protein FGO68_gene11172 [Halteria grandinella]